MPPGTIEALSRYPLCAELILLVEPLEGEAPGTAIEPHIASSLGGACRAPAIQALACTVGRSDAASLPASSASQSASSRLARRVKTLAPIPMPNSTWPRRMRLGGLNEDALTGTPTRIRRPVWRGYGLVWRVASSQARRSPRRAGPGASTHVAERERGRPFEARLGACATASLSTSSGGHPSTRREQNFGSRDSVTGFTAETRGGMSLVRRLVP